MRVLKRIATQWRRALWRRRGEQCLLDTFWPNDYRIGTNIWHHGHSYRITRYDHVPGARLFSVWGQPISSMAEHILPDPRIKRLVRAQRRAADVVFLDLEPRTFDQHVRQSRGVYTSLATAQLKRRGYLAGS